MTRSRYLGGMRTELRLRLARTILRLQAPRGTEPPGAPEAGRASETSHTPEENHATEPSYAPEAADLITQFHARGVLTVATPEERADRLQPMVQWVAGQDASRLKAMSSMLRDAIAVTAAPAMPDVPLLDALCTLFYAACTARVRLGAAVGDAGAVSVALCRILELGPSEVPSEGAFRDAYRLALDWYYADFNRPAQHLIEPLTSAIRRWSGSTRHTLDVLCDLGDFHFFASFWFEPSASRQCPLAIPAMRALDEAMARSLPDPDIRGERRLPAPLPPGSEPVHVGFLAMGADPADTLTVALRHVAPALLTRPGRFRLTVYAWCNVAPDFVEWLRSLGATCHVIVAPTPTKQIEAIEEIASRDPPAVLISDINMSLPTAIFARRLAPVQVFLQGGMPAWSVSNLDAVFSSFGFDPEAAGWGNARVLGFATPWDLNLLNPPERPEELAAERLELPQGLRLIGNYGRLVKVTQPFLRAVERMLQACPDVAFVTGGAGDGTAIRAFIADSPVKERMRLVERYVPGHSWGRLLDVYLDTWPLTGGESVRETMAKGCAVVAIHSDDMPALDQQRDRALLAQDWDGFVDLAVRLLHDPAALAIARQRAAAFAARWADPAPFSAYLDAAIEQLLEDARYRAAHGSTPDQRPLPELGWPPAGLS